MLVGLDRESNSLLAIDPTTAASSVILGVASTVGAIGGMAAIGDSGFFATSGPSSSPTGSNTLYSFERARMCRLEVFRPTSAPELVDWL
jgi:hypothetical protein